MARRSKKPKKQSRKNVRRKKGKKVSIRRSANKAIVVKPAEPYMFAKAVSPPARRSGKK